MGNKLGSQDSQRIDWDLLFGSNFVFLATIGSGRFLKSHLCDYVEGKVVVKVHTKSQPMNVASILTSLKELHDKILSCCPNVIPYRKMAESEKFVWVARQYFFYNLADRMVTRPFFSDGEKKWIAFQLLMAVHQLHQSNTTHGDLKCENVMVTSWKWVYLTDVSVYIKPTYLPEDDPSDFYFFFDCSNTEKCSLAPERIVAGNSPLLEDSSSNPPLSSMDMFSLGCILAELFLDVPLFDLPSLLRYRSGDDEPLDPISRITDPGIQKMILQLLNRDPTERGTPSFFLANCESFGMSKNFGFLHSYLGMVLSLVPDTLIETIYDDLNHLILHLFEGYKEKKDETSPETSEDGTSSPTSSLFQPTSLSPFLSSKEPVVVASQNKKENSSTPSPQLTGHSSSMSSTLEKGELLLDLEYFIQQKEPNFSLTDSFPSLGETSHVPSEFEGESFDQSDKNKNLNREELQSRRSYGGRNIRLRMQRKTETNQKPLSLFDVNPLRTKKSPSSSLTDRPNELKIPQKSPSPSTQKLNKKEKQFQSILKRLPPKEFANEGYLLSPILSILLAHIRSVASPYLRQKALEVIHCLGLYVDDSCRFQSIVPYLMNLLTDFDLLVKCRTLRILCTVLKEIRSLPSIEEADLFEEWILPGLQFLVPDSDEQFLLELCGCVRDLSLVAKRFLEMRDGLWEREKKKIEAQVFESQNGAENGEVDDFGELAKELETLKRLVLDLCSALLFCERPSVQRKMLACLPDLFPFFGGSMTENFVLPLVTTFLNNSDWHVRSECYNALIQSAGLIKSSSFIEYFSVCLSSGLVDAEENAMRFTLDAIYHVVGLNSPLPLSVMPKLFRAIGPLLVHPNTGLRHTSASLLEVLTKQLDYPTRACCLAPILKELLPSTSPGEWLWLVEDLKATVLLSVLPKLSRSLFTEGLLIAASTTLFFKQQKPIRTSETSALSFMIQYSKRAITKEQEKREKEVQERVGENGSSTDPDFHGEDPHLGDSLLSDFFLSEGDLFDPSLENSPFHLSSSPFLQADEMILEQTPSLSSNKGYTDMFREHLKKVPDIPQEDRKILESISDFLSSHSAVLQTKRRYPFVYKDKFKKQVEDTQLALFYSTVDSLAPHFVCYECQQTTDANYVTFVSPPEHPCFTRQCPHSTPTKDLVKRRKTTLFEPSFVASRPSSISSLPAARIRASRYSPLYSGSQTSPTSLQSQNQFEKPPAVRLETSAFFLVASHNSNKKISASSPTPEIPKKVEEKERGYFHRRLKSDPSCGDVKGIDVQIRHLSDGLEEEEKVSSASLETIRATQSYPSSSVLSVLDTSEDNSPSSPQIEQKFSNNLSSQVYLGHVSRHPELAHHLPKWVTCPDIPALLGSFSKSKTALKRLPSSSSSSCAPWKPKGNIMAEIKEHKGSVNRLCVFPDHSLFASCSDDGYIKVWDLRKEEQISVFRASMTIKGQNTDSMKRSPLKAMCVCQDTASLVVGSLAGEVNIFRVDEPPSGTRGPIPLYSYTETSGIVDLHYHDQKVSPFHSFQSIVVSTSRDRILAKDIRTQSDAWVFHPPPALGPLSCCRLDPTGTWLVAGTQNGSYVCFDPRFSASVRTWNQPPSLFSSKNGERREKRGQPFENQIHRIFPFNWPISNPLFTRGATEGFDSLFAASVNSNQFWIWDVANMKSPLSFLLSAPQPLSAFSPVSSASVPPPFPSSPKKSFLSRSFSILSLSFSSSPQTASSSPQLSSSPSSSNSSLSSIASTPSVSLPNSASTPLDSLSSVSLSSRSRIETGDKKEKPHLDSVLEKIKEEKDQESTIASGATMETERTEALRAFYQLPGSILTGGGDGIVRCWDMKNPSQSFVMHSGNKSKYDHTGSEEEQKEENTCFRSRTKFVDGTFTFVEEEQDHAPQGHPDSITDIQTLHIPHNMVISASRDGSILIWK